MAEQTAARIGRTYQESEPRYPEPQRPQPGSPNIVYVVLDDVGFADLGCYGSEINTPVMDRLARDGAQYNNFHTTTLCSPSRAALLTGRNHHSVGMRMLSNVDSGWPSGRGRITERAATVSEVLRDLGYNTWALGKWHVTPMDEVGPTGPFNQWPLGRGFERFYGFMEGATDQFSPELTCDNRRVDPPRTPDEGYHLSEDLVDQACNLVADQLAHAPDKPYFMYLAFGAAHAPHQAPDSYLERCRGRYRDGWEVIRRRRYERQLELGVIPADTILPPSNPDVPDWDSLSDTERRVAERLQEAYAAFLEHTDAQLGRLVDRLAEADMLDNTLIVLLSDNGAAMEGGPLGAFSRVRFFNDLPNDVEAAAARLDDIGTPRGDNHYPVGWAQASNTPLRWYKYHTHGGGIRDPLIVHWPRGIRPGELRQQFHHVVDITPTILECVGATMPDVYRGVPQLPTHGESMKYTFGTPDADARKQTQYFEMFGNRALWHDGWKAVTFHVKGTSYDEERWELYHLDRDFSEANDLSSERPDKLRELIDRWWHEAGKYNVLPLDDRSVELFQQGPRHGTPGGRRHYIYLPQTSHIHPKAAPRTIDASYRIVALVEREGVDDEGVLIAHGDRWSGYVFYLKDNRLFHEYNFCGTRYTMSSSAAVPLGKSELTFEFERTGELQGDAALRIDGETVATCHYPQTLRFVSMAGMDVGRDALTPVSDAYHAPFTFSGRLRKLTFDTDAPDGSDGELLDD